MSSPPPTPSTANAPHRNTNACDFVPGGRSTSKVTIRSQDGMEVTLDALKKHSPQPPTVPIPPASPVVTNRRQPSVSERIKSEKLKRTREEHAWKEQLLGTPTMAHAILHPPHTPQPLPSISPSPPTPSTANAPRLNTNAHDFVPGGRSTSKVTIRSQDGMEVTLDALKKHSLRPPTVPIPPASPVVTNRRQPSVSERIKSEKLKRTREEHAWKEQLLGTPTMAHAILHPPHTPQPLPSISPSPPTPSTANAPRLNTNAHDFVPGGRSTSKVTIRSQDGMEVTLDALKKHSLRPPTVPIPPASPVVTNRWQPSVSERIESEKLKRTREEHARKEQEKRDDEERAKKDAIEKKKCEAEEEAKRMEEEEAARKRKAEEDRIRMEEEKERI